MAVSISSKELIKVLDITPAEQNIMLCGKHGIGKSEILTKYFEEKGMKVVALFLGQMADPGDLIGLPHKNEETGRMEFMPPYWFPKENEPIVLFLDELNRARPELLQTVMDLALNRKLAGRKLPEGSRIISAVNDGEEYQLTDLDPALVSRFNIYCFRPTVEEWLLWASKNGVDERIVKFIQDKPIFLEGNADLKNNEDRGLDKTPDRRAWVKVSKLIKGTDSIGDFHKKLISGVVGVSATGAFIKSLGEEVVISAKKLLSEYDKHKDKVAKYQLHELSILNESVFRTLENGILKEMSPEVAAKNFNAYVNDLDARGNKEALAHMITLIESGNYTKSASFMVKYLGSAYKKLVKMINEI